MPQVGFEPTTRRASTDRSTIGATVTGSGSKCRSLHDRFWRSVWAPAHPLGWKRRIRTSVTGFRVRHHTARSSSISTDERSCTSTGFRPPVPKTGVSAISPHPLDAPRGLKPRFQRPKLWVLSLDERAVFRQARIFFEFHADQLTPAGQVPMRGVAPPRAFTHPVLSRACLLFHHIG